MVLYREDDKFVAVDTAVSYDDVQIVPQKSDIDHRDSLSLTHKVGPLLLEIPIIPANMDSISSPTVCMIMAERGGLGILPREKDDSHLIDSLREMIEDRKCRYTYIVDKIKLQPSYGYIGFSVGTRENSELFHRLAELFQTNSTTGIIPVIFVEVAHAHHELVKKTCDQIREAFGTQPFILGAGNIATYDAALYLGLDCGVQLLKVGVGPGCFIPGSIVKTEHGLKKIEDIEIGDRVYTHTGELHRVTQLFSYDRDEFMVNINGVTSTASHEYYVVEKRDADLITEDNLSLYARWIPAAELDITKHLLIENIL